MFQDAGFPVHGRVAALCVTVVCSLVRLVIYLVGFLCGTVSCARLLTSSNVLMFVTLFANEIWVHVGMPVMS